MAKALLTRSLIDVIPRSPNEVQEQQKILRRRKWDIITTHFQIQLRKDPILIVLHDRYLEVHNDWFRCFFVICACMLKFPF